MSCCNSLDDAKAEQTVAVDITGKSSLADHMVVTSGRSQPPCRRRRRPAGQGPARSRLRQAAHRRPAALRLGAGRCAATSSSTSSAPKCASSTTSRRCGRPTSPPTRTKPVRCASTIAAVGRMKAGPGARAGRALSRSRHRPAASRWRSPASRSSNSPNPALGPSASRKAEEAKAPARRPARWHRRGARRARQDPSARKPSPTRSAAGATMAGRPSASSSAAPTGSTRTSCASADLALELFAADLAAPAGPHHAGRAALPRHHDPQRAIPITAAIEPRIAGIATWLSNVNLRLCWALAMVRMRDSHDAWSGDVGATRQEVGIAAGGPGARLGAAPATIGPDCAAHRRN